MSKERTMMIRLEALMETFYVREVLNQDRVDFFADLYTGKGEVDPLLVGQLDGKETIHLIDGRHRKHALLSLEVAETKCRLRVFETWADMVVAAVEANWGGSLPQTEGDLKYTIRMMLEHGVGRNTLYAKFPFIPHDLMRKLLDQTQADIAAAKMRSALSAVAAEEMRPSEAAKKFEIPLADLKRRIAGVRQDKRPAQAQVKSNISNRFKELSALLGKQLGAALKMFESGELNEGGFEDVISHIRRLLDKVASNVGNYEGRFRVMAGTPNSGTAATGKSGKTPGESALKKMGLKGGKQ